MKTFLQGMLLLLGVSLSHLTYSQNVLVCGSPNDQLWLNDVQSKLIATGQFTSVDIFNSGLATPTLAYLTSYDAVLHFTDMPPFNNVDLGNNLAAYVDQGGGVVNCVFTMASVPISGAFSGDTYSVAQYANAQSQSTSLALGTVFDSAHPIMAGISLLDGGTSSYHSPGNSFVAGSTVLANWSNGIWLAAVRENVGPLAVRRADLNIYPPSSDARNDFWVSGTNGALLMANALSWVLGGNVPGCMDPTACNYNSAANVNDGSCVYAQTYYPDTDGDGYGNGSIGPGGVDQSQLVSNTCMANFLQPDLAQSFTPSSPIICGAKVFITSGGATGDVTISLYTNLPNAGGLLLAQGTDLALTAGQWAEVNWSGVTVNTGSTYYLVFTSTVQDLCLGGDLYNSYSGGQVFANGGFNGFANYDYTFETISCGGSIDACTQPVGYVSNNTDCNDNSNTVFPNATEICGNGIDDDCDLAVDEGALTTYYYDFDNDGFGTSADSLILETCLPPAGYVTLNGDCNDYNAQLNPNGAPCIYGCVSPLSCNYDAFANTDNGSCINATYTGFFGDYDPQNWITTLDGSGLVNFNNTSLFIQGSDGIGGTPYNGVSIQIPVSGTYTFDYSYFTNDDNAYFDMGVYINGYPIDLVNNDQTTGSGTMSIFVYAGNTLGFGIQQIDDLFGSATLTITNFIYPVQCVTGCMDVTACNYTEFVNFDDGSCIYPSISYYVDSDGDGFGNPLGNILGCETPPFGFVSDNTDCNDSAVGINPAAQEIVGNAIDENCDGQIEMSISELENSLSIELFPNPSSQYLNIRISQNAVGQKFELLDLTGRIILSNRINATQETIDLSGFAEGQYALRCLNTIKMFSIIK